MWDINLDLALKLAEWSFKVENKHEIEYNRKLHNNRN